MAFARRKKTQKPYDYKRSWNYVLWLLGRKAYTKKQLRDKLVRKEAEEAVIERVMTKLQELKFVDDKGFADMYVRSRQRRKGRIALRRELYQKGVAEELIDETLEPLETDTQVETARALLEKNLWRYKKGDVRKRWGKAYAFLARRGFTGDVVKAALEEVDLSDEEAA